MERLMETFLAIVIAGIGVPLVIGAMITAVAAIFYGLSLL
jgi:hypothetical protein